MRQFLIVIISLGVLVFSAQAEALRLTILNAEAGEAYQEFSASFIAESQRQNPGLDIIQSTTLPSDTDLIIAVGLKSASIANGGKFPVLCVLVSKAGFEKLVSELPENRKSKPIAAVFLDQPITRQVALIAASLPNFRNIGVLYSNHSADMGIYRKAISDRNLKMHEQNVDSAESLFRDLEAVLGKSDVLLTIPDASIYNALSMRNILLTTYRYKVPVVGLSPAYVRAGALCAVFSSPAQIAVQAAKLATQFAEKGVFPLSQYPTDFNVSINLQVARSLGLQLKEDTAIVREIKAAESMQKGDD